jgi:hypothetical protein
MAKLSKGLTLRPGQRKKIAKLHPHLRNVINALLKSHGVNAKVHQISYGPVAPKPTTLISEVSAVGICHMEGNVWVCD